MTNNSNFGEVSWVCPGGPGHNPHPLRLSNWGWARKTNRPSEQGSRYPVEWCRSYAVVLLTAQSERGFPRGDQNPTMDPLGPIPNSMQTLKPGKPITKFSQRQADITTSQVATEASGEGSAEPHGRSRELTVTREARSEAGVNVDNNPY